jgi:hypothetical protein
MTRRSADDERGLVPPVRFFPSGERIYLKELARYLGHDYQALLKWAQKRGLATLERQHYRSARAWWVTPRTAMRLIVVARGIQGEFLLRGKDYQAQKEQSRRQKQAERARKRVEQVNTRLAEHLQEQFALAFPAAGTEDESRGDGRNVSPSQQDEA